MNSKMIGQLVGGLLVLVAIILAVIQHFGGNDYNLYGDVGNRWYFYGLVGIVGLIGIVLIAWYLMKKQ